ncbi:unnamed protein product [Rangifer tarandus platyrhynchus]|uniref:Uncharacterized protein n=1 Tax=Rangifer tarandus platyrhynchus TaxID=3082113 RepID=A0ABN8Z709_RANTA|nr:unnamed protein product [Rangifer tarandus platyrhynchus]
MGPPSTAFPGRQRQVFCRHPFGAAWPAAVTGGGLETVAGPGCGLVSVEWAAFRVLPGMAVVSCYTGRMSSGPGAAADGPGAASGHRRCLARLSRCEAWGAWGDTRVSSVDEAQGQGPSPSPAVVPYLHQVVLAQPGEAPMLCGAADTRRLPSPPTAQVGRACALELQAWGGGAESVPISAVTGYDETAKRVLIRVPSLDEVPAGSSLFSSCFEFSQWVSFPCRRGAFHSAALRGISGPVPLDGST